MPIKALIKVALRKFKSSASKKVIRTFSGTYYNTMYIILLSYRVHKNFRTGLILSEKTADKAIGFCTSSWQH